MVKKLYFFLVIPFLVSAWTIDDSKIDLSGEWRFQIDYQEIGISQKWFNSQFEETIILPGSMSENGKGDPVGFETKWLGGIQEQKWYNDKNYKPYLNKDNFLFPFWLSPELHYYGAAWYQKNVEVPSSWEGDNIELFLERCHWETRVWVDDNEAGMRNSLGTPHQYDLSELLSPGKHTITICVDNRLKEVNVGPNSHSVSDHTQGNWNGITGRIQLIRKAPVFIRNIKVFPDILRKTIDIDIITENNSNSSFQGTLLIQAKGINQRNMHTPVPLKIDINITQGQSITSVPFRMGEGTFLWDEFDPNLYKLSLELRTEKGIDQKEVQFGMRNFSVKGSRFEINGWPVFLRGTLDCAAFPKTGYPPTDINEWERIIKVCKAHGLNHIRFHSWCPPEAAFLAADKLGFYYQVECSSWANQGSTIGDGYAIDDWIFEESERMVNAYGNHPSFVLMAYGNEPAGENQKEFLNDFVNFWKNKDSRRVYTGGAGWPVISANEFHNIPQPRIQGWGEQLNSKINGEPPQTAYDWTDRMTEDGKPVVSHEIGQWCVYPDFKEIKKYDGILKAKNFELFKLSLSAHKMDHLADSFLLASGKLQALCYKAEIEAALRTKNQAGFQLLGLSDFPGQGTALIGVLNAFWEEKGYISPEEFQYFCNEVVPLARLTKRIFFSNEIIRADVEVANFGRKRFENTVSTWEIVDDHGKIYTSGEFQKSDIPLGSGIKLGTIETRILTDKPVQLALRVNLSGYVNTWNIWVYPSELTNNEGAGDIYFTQEFDKKAKDILNKGGKVLISTKKGSIKPKMGGNVGIGFSPIFWNTAWTGGQKPHTLGILCNPSHPALASFPTNYHSDWQWWDAMSHSNAISLENFPADIQPIVRVIDDWVSNQKLALIFEAKIGNGKLLISGIDLINDKENRAEARQLLFSLKEYMGSESFDPKIELDKSQIAKLFK